MKIVDNASWFDYEYRELRKKRRKAEKTFRQTRNQEDRDAFVALRKETTKMARGKKQEHYVSKIREATNKPKMLFKVVNTLTDSEKVNALPTAASDTILANNFLSYFREKIRKIRQSFQPAASPSDESTTANISSFHTFDEVTEDELKEIIKSYGVNTSPEDPIPANLLKDHADILIPYWLEIVNLSLSTGSMDCLVSAVISPLLKEADGLVDPELYPNFRPVSNLIFLSKLIERCVKVQLDKHMSRNKLHSEQAYGYKSGHSTELLLVDVVDNLLTAFDKKQASVLLLLDLSAAFDTVDQTKLLQMLHSEIKMEGTVLKWFEAFIKGRSQRVKINNAYSESETLEYGLAQGSVLGPPLFNIYIRPFYPFIQSSSYSVKGFADDHQLFRRFVPVFQTHVLGTSINDCLSMVSEWMNTFFLKLNKSKTKILVLAPPDVLSLIEIHGMFMAEECIRFVSSAKNLGVWLDEHLDFRTHIRKVASSCFMTLRDIAKIKNFIPRECLCIVVCSLILSRLDYCNALYYNIHSKDLDLLQSVQNAAIRLVGGRFKYDRKPISPLYHELHWLRIRERIVFKICLIVHKCVWGAAPESLREMIVLMNKRTLKVVEKRYYSVYGQRSFSCAGPKLWNCLPMALRMEENTDEFKKLLKSFLMTSADMFYQQVNMR